MNVHIFLYISSIARDIRLLLRQREIKKKNTNNLFYNSEVVEKIELSVEMLYEVFYPSKCDLGLFEKKKYLVFLLELIRLGFRFKELKVLSSFGYNFYIEKNIYLSQIMGMSDEDFITKMEIAEY